MAEKFVYTGRYRAKTLVVKRIDLGTQNTYNFLNSFTQNSVTYDAITEDELAVQSDNDYQTRLAAFYNWVETQEAGLETDSISINAQHAAHGTDVISCPINTEFTGGDPVT